MFQFRGFPPHSYGFTVRCYGIAVTGFPIRISAGLWIFAPNRSFSQLVTSFFGSWCQVILPTLFIAWPLTWFELLRIRDFLLMLLKFFTLSYILIYFGKTFPHFLCLIIFIYYPWVCIYFILFGLSKYFLAFTLYHRFALFSFQGTKFCWIFFHTSLVNNMCIWNRFLFETDLTVSQKSYPLFKISLLALLIRLTTR